MTTVTRATLREHGISHVIDDALSPDHTAADFEANGLGVIVGFQCGFDQLLIGVISYLPGVAIEPDEAIDIAEDYVREIGWLKSDTEISVYVWAQLPDGGN